MNIVLPTGSGFLQQSERVLPSLLLLLLALIFLVIVSLFAVLQRIRKDPSGKSHIERPCDVGGEGKRVALVFLALLLICLVAFLMITLLVWLRGG